MAVPMPSSLSLHEVLAVQGQPVTEEQAWALCYHGCQSIQQQQRLATNWASWLMNWKQPQFRSVDDLILNEDGTVVCVSAGNDGKKNTCSEEKVIESLGVLIYKALDWSLSDNEERVLSPPLEYLIQQMALRSEDQPPVTIDEIILICGNHLQDPSSVSSFQAVNKALFAETMELRQNLSNIRSAKATLKRLLEEDSLNKASPDSACWNRVWFQLMKEVRSGVRLRKASERSYSPVPVKPEQSLFKKLLDDIKYKRYFLHKVMRNNKPRTSSETLLDFGLLRSLLKPVTARKLRDAPSSSPSLHKLLMKEIQSGVRKLHPVSPDVESQSMDNLGNSEQTELGLQHQNSPTNHEACQQMSRSRKVEFMDLESEADRSGLEQNSGRESRSSDTVQNQADISAGRVSPKPSSWLDVTKPLMHSLHKYKFRYPLQIGKPLDVGYEFVENEEFHYSSSLFVKELACICQTGKREVRLHKMVKDKFCFFCQRELFFTWAFTCHLCKKINLFRVLYEDVNPLPCMHLPFIYKPLAARTVDASVQAERCRCGWEEAQQCDSSKC